MNIFKSISLESYPTELCFPCAYLCKMDKNNMQTKVFLSMSKEKQIFIVMQTVGAA